ncbi:MAG: hypothetical protein DRI57_19405 [Deltaproteobacteria bacterium]|nr:MAG: hypothetical protein DRI57_19405 [Deltaproteobacteria bacterium]
MRLCVKYFMISHKGHREHRGKKEKLCVSLCSLRALCEFFYAITQRAQRKKRETLCLFVFFTGFV